MDSDLVKNEKASQFPPRTDSEKAALKAAFVACFGNEHSVEIDAIDRNRRHIEQDAPEDVIFVYYSTNTQYPAPEGPTEFSFGDRPPVRVLYVWYPPDELFTLH